jgi:hypothetical protein
MSPEEYGKIPLGAKPWPLGYSLPNAPSFIRISAGHNGNLLLGAVRSTNETGERLLAEAIRVAEWFVGRRVVCKLEVWTRAEAGDYKTHIVEGNYGARPAVTWKEVLR